MTILTILEYPHPNLKAHADPVTEFGDHLMTLIEDMYETMYDDKGCGLAATQVDVQKRIIVMDVSQDQTDRRYFINPVIIEHEGEVEGEEGCLSFPGIYAKVKRFKWIKVQYQNVKGETLTFESDEFISICIQHEIDHLDGICFVDHLSLLKRERLLKKLEKRRKENL